MHKEKERNIPFLLIHPEVFAECCLCGGLCSFTMNGTDEVPPHTPFSIPLQYECHVPCRELKQDTGCYLPGMLLRLCGQVVLTDEILFKWRLESQELVMQMGAEGLWLMKYVLLWFILVSAGRATSSHTSCFPDSVLLLQSEKSGSAWR